MRVKIGFIFTTNDDVDDWNIQKMVWRKSIKLKEYKDGTWGCDQLYLVDQSTDLYNSVVELFVKYKESIQFKKICKEVEIDEEDKSKAVAFILLGTDNYCEEYMDTSYEYKECDYCRVNAISDDVFYIQPTGYVKRMQDKMGMADIDGKNAIVLFPALVKKMIEEGVDESFFQPVFSKRKKILGYVFTTNNILSKGAYVDDNYNKPEICPVCGAVYLRQNKDEHYFLPKRIKKEVVLELKDVNYTEEYYDGFRELIISPKVQQIISKYIKNAMFIPIFPE